MGCCAIKSAHLAQMTHPLWLHGTTRPAGQLGRATPTRHSHCIGSYCLTGFGYWGADSIHTLVTRAGIAQSLGEVGNVAGAMKAYTALIADQNRVLGPNHPETLTARHNLAMWTEAAEDRRSAVEQLTVVLKDRSRVLGPDHPDTRITRRNLDRMLARSAISTAREGTEPRPQGPKGTRRTKRKKGKEAHQKREPTLMPAGVCTRAGNHQNST